MYNILIFRKCFRGDTVTNSVRVLGVLFPSRRFKSEFPPRPDLGSSTILIQDGCNVQELPIIVRKVKNALSPFERVPDCMAGFDLSYGRSAKDVQRMIHKEFIKCLNYREVLLLLSRCNSVTPNIAIGAVERIVLLNDGTPREDIFTSGGDVSVKDILDKLTIIIKLSSDIDCILRGLELLQSHGDVYKEAYTEAILDRLTDDKLSVKQLCTAVKLFSVNKHCPDSAENIEKLWVGFVNREKELTKQDLVSTFEILPLLKNSRRIVLSSIERNIPNLWWQMTCQNVINILHILHDNKLNSVKTLSVLARWLNTNVHTITEDDMTEIINKFCQMNYADEQIEKALERYMKAKGIKIISYTLVATILNYCMLFKVRNVHIMNGCAEFFISHGKKLPPLYIKPLLFPFGFLNFNPANRSKFWEEVETSFDNKFSKMNVEDVLDVMLTCIYLEKYPLNFVDRVFNPSFLDRVNRVPNYHKLKSKLKLIDTAMTLECKAYTGPLLPRDHSKSMWFDQRIKRLVHQLQPDFQRMAGGSQHMSTFVLLPRIFATELYLVDIMMHPPGLRVSLLNLNLSNDRNINTALLIHLPEHYCSRGECLIGPQAMRKKHLKILGLKVVSLKYQTLSKLRMYPADLSKYITDCIKNAESAESL